MSFSLSEYTKIDVGWEWGRQGKGRNLGGGRGNSVLVVGA